MIQNELRALALQTPTLPRYKALSRLKTIIRTYGFKAKLRSYIAHLTGEPMDALRAMDYVLYCFEDKRIDPNSMIEGLAHHV